MKKLIARSKLAGLVLLSLMLCNIALAQGQGPDNVAGNWTIYSTNIDNGEIVVKHVQIAQYGNRITGYFEGPFQSGPIQGEVHIHHIRFSTVTRNVLNFQGQIYGENMSGNYGLHGRHAAWQAVRTSSAAAQQAPAAVVASYPNEQPVIAPPAPAPAPAVAQQAPPQTETTQAEPEAAPAAESSVAPTPAPLSSDQLDALVAPIALYPDALVAQVLAAATFPDQVAIADYWLSQNSSLSGTALAQAVDQQTWDASVKALTQFPSILDILAKNLPWTSSLGQAFSNQQSDVMAAVQVMRAKAQAAGTLQSSSQITVTQPSSNVIVIQPANPQVVYVPQYNPTVVYGAPIAVPLYTPPATFMAAGLSFGSGISVGAVFGGGGGFVAGGGFGWGFNAWACNWGGGGGNTIIYNRNTYITNNTWRNNNYNGYHPWGPRNTGYHPDTDTHYGPNGDYHPNGYYGPNGAFHHDVPGTNPNDQPNGGHNGDHGLIGGNGGVEHAANGGSNGDHGLIGGNGGVDHGPNGGRNGDGGLIGGNGGVRDRNAGMNGPGVAPSGGYHDRNENRVASNNRSRMSGNGAANRAESERGRGSMAGRRPQAHVARTHAPVEHHSSGGGAHRR
ncbi:MAG: DUF3300 domain-containing protein [Candidatus Acidiferrales bacterium]